MYRTLIGFEFREKIRRDSKYFATCCPPFLSKESQQKQIPDSRGALTRKRELCVKEVHLYSFDVRYYVVVSCAVLELKCSSAQFNFNPAANFK
jgi:hypothetical protein